MSDIFESIQLQGRTLCPLCLEILDYKFIQKHQCLVFEIAQNAHSISIAICDASAPVGLIRSHISHIYPHALLRFFHIEDETFALFSQQIYLFQRFNALKNTLLEQHTHKSHQIDVDSDMSVVALLDFILETAIAQRTSDIHLESFEYEGKQSARIRVRIDGMLREMFGLESYVLEALSSRLKLECELDITQTRQSQDGRFAREFNGQRYDFRLSILPSFGGESLVIRILSQDTQAIDLQNLGFNVAHLTMIERHIHTPNGIILLTGPTGSGKSTTLYAMIESIKSPSKKIITLEDPIEYHTQLTTQVLIHDKYDFGFSKALRALLRHDPDVLMIGEIRDKESLDIALRASLTGHLVLSTLHANDALSVIERLLDMGAQHYLLTSSIRLILSQRLVRTLCEHCKVEVATEIMRDIFKQFQLTHLWENAKDGRFFKPSGCVYCGMQGFSGRTLIAECLEYSHILRDYITSPIDKERTLSALRASGFRSLLENGIEILKNGQSCFEEIYRVCHI